MNVSVRTIQRDMISISTIGVPIYSESRKNGGYSILPTYKIKNSEIRSDEQQMIIKALESLATSYTNDTLKTLIEKYNAIVQKEGGQKVFWDFGVTKENADVQSKNQLLKHAIDQKNMCYLNTAMLMEEYFPDCPIEQISEDTKRMFIDVPAKERLWKALLLSFGNKVKVIGPEEYRKELIQTAQNFYQITTYSCRSIPFKI